jgi:hypothetical protein
MARKPAPAVRALPRRLNLLADAPDLARAARVEAAARGRPTGARHRALEPDSSVRRGRIRHRDRGEQGTRVRVIRRAEDFLHRAQLHQLPEVHHADTVGDMPLQAQVMRDEDIRRVEPPPQLR